MSVANLMVNHLVGIKVFVQRCFLFFFKERGNLV